jgi:LmbE family N-acetylglucosaminyl deacetylase
VVCIAQIISATKPEVIFVPHANDAHPTHIGVHFLVMDALASLGGSLTCTIVQTEYWQPQYEPNLLVGVSEKDAAKLLDALACHRGENARNPYDVRLPAYLIDNVRRASERISSHGAPAVPVDFAMLYAIGLWKNGKFIPSALKRIIEPSESVATLFA